MKNVHGYYGSEEFVRMLLKCSYCGFCEWVCPTLKVKLFRLYGPRGRINSLMFAIKEGAWSSEALESIYSCTLCGSCAKQCPAGIKVESLVRLFRYYLFSRDFKVG